MAESVKEDALGFDPGVCEQVDGVPMPWGFKPHASCRELVNLREFLLPLAGFLEHELPARALDMDACARYSDAEQCLRIQKSKSNRTSLPARR